MSDTKDILREIVSDADSAYAQRSCRNCLHVNTRSQANESMFWMCERLGGYCDSNIHGLCGVNLCYWALRPERKRGFWARLFRV